MRALPLRASLILLATVCLPLAAQDVDPVRAAAAKTFASRQDSAVRLTITRKIKERDQTFEIPAVSFDGKDLLVTSMGGIEIGGRGGDKGELTRVALLRADATEAEADLVLTDAALDLAFVRVRPDEATTSPLPAAPPHAKAPPVLLEEVLSIRRQGPAFQRVASVELDRIAALVTTPRTLYIPSSSLLPGTAVYNLAGEMVGLVTSMNNERVIVPVDAVAKLAASIPAKEASPASSGASSKP